MYTLKEMTRDGRVTREQKDLDERTAWKWYEWSDAAWAQLYNNGELIAERRI